MINENFILTVDDVFTKEDCEKLISLYNKNLTVNKDTSYDFLDINVDSFLYLNKFAEVLEMYKTKYEEVDMTASYWALNTLRFKLFKKGDCFSQWHSEHCFSHQYRVLSMQLYLTEHNCGTEFYNNKKTILSKIGRVCIFPAYFTHTHKGQPDFLKDRMIITGYYNFTEKGKNEI